MRVLLSPRLLAAHLLALVCVGIAVAMGAWQYDAWQVRREVEQRDLTNAEPRAMTDLIGPDAPFPGDYVGQPVTVEGTWLPEGTVFITRQDSEGTEGAWVVTPLTVGAPGDPAVPVVRGWFPGTAAKGLVPEVSGQATIEGWLQPPEGTGQTDPDPHDDVLPQLRVADLVQRVDQDLYGAYVVSREPGAGLREASLDQLPPVGTFTALRNLLYAVEWWFFAAFAAFMWWRYVRDATRDGPTGTTTGEPAGATDDPADGHRVASTP